VNTYIVMHIVHMFCTCYDWVHYNGIVIDTTSMEPDLQRSTLAVVYPIKTAEGWEGGNTKYVWCCIR